MRNLLVSIAALPGMACSSGPEGAAQHQVLQVELRAGTAAGGALGQGVDTIVMMRLKYCQHVTYIAMS